MLYVQICNLPLRLQVTVVVCNITQMQSMKEKSNEWTTAGEFADVAGC